MRVRRRLHPWATLGLLLIVFGVTRAAGGWLAHHPERYRAGRVTLTQEVKLYEIWGIEAVRERSAYRDVRIEYPPGALPFLITPLAVSDGRTYRPRFIALMLIIDIAGLVGLILIARRTRSWLGPWLWTILVPMLGPIAYLRLDLAPAVATIWALERAQAGAWFGAGGWLGFGAVTKIYPGLLLPLLLASRWRWRVVLGAALIMTLSLIPFVGSLPGLWESVVGYHSQRGLQVESTWGAALLSAGHADAPVQVVFNHGAFNVHGPGASALKSLSLVLSVGALAAGVALARARVRPGSAADLAAMMFGTVALLLTVGKVFSPQYMLWLSALGAVSASLVGRALRLPLALLVCANALSQVVFPFQYSGLLTGGSVPLTALIVRNAAVGAIAVLVFRRLWNGNLGSATLRRSAGTVAARAVGGTSAPC